MITHYGLRFLQNNDDASIYNKWYKPGRWFEKGTGSVFGDFTGIGEYVAGCNKFFKYRLLNLY